MKKICSVLAFAIISTMCYGQEKTKSFSHMLQENIGFYYTDYLLFENANNFSIRGGKGLLNLIPSYELGYNDKWFAKVRIRNYCYDNITSEGDFFDATWYWGKTKTILSLDCYSVVLSYNIMKPTSNHITKVGVNFSYMAYSHQGEVLEIKPAEMLSNARQQLDRKIKEKSFALGIEIDYKHKLNNHFAIGAEADLIYSFDNFTAGSASFVLSYTF